jgi:SpoVK/Ycf46/Vps4 family AAA+-type ATPase
VTDFMLALKEIQPSAQHEDFATVPYITWSGIGALHATRSELHMAIVQSIRRPELFRAVGIDALAGILLWGPPGCGKTLLAKAVANESQASFISPELVNRVRRFSRTIPEIEILDAQCSMLARVSAWSVRYLPEHAPPLHVSSSSTNSTNSVQDAT